MAHYPEDRMTKFRIRVLPRPANVIFLNGIFTQRWKREPARQRIIKQDPETKNIRLFVAAEITVSHKREVRRHVIKGAFGTRRSARRGGFTVILASDAKIKQFWDALARDIYVGRFEVTVNDAVFARILQRLQDLRKNCACILPWESPAIFFQKGFKRFTVEQLHHQAVDVFFQFMFPPDERIPVADNVRVIQPAKDFYLAPKLLRFFFMAHVL